jgi:hypothetical protein
MFVFWLGGVVIVCWFRRSGRVCLESYIRSLVLLGLCCVPGSPSQVWSRPGDALVVLGAL